MAENIVTIFTLFESCEEMAIQGEQCRTDLELNAAQL